MSENLKKEQEKTAKGKFGRNLIIGLAVLLVLYVGLGFYFESHFYPRSSVNGVGVSGASASKALNIYTTAGRNYQLTLKEMDGSTETVSQEDVGLVVSGQPDQFKALIKAQNGFLWGAKLFAPEEYVLEGAVAFSDSSIKKAVANLNCVKGHTTESKDAYVEFSGDKYEIRNEVYGDEVDVPSLEKAIAKAVSMFEKEISLEDELCYVQPNVKANDADILATAKHLNDCIESDLVYTIGDEEVKVDKALVNQWVSLDDNMNLVLDEEAITEYVKALAASYDTYGKPKNFKTSKGEDITVPGGTYGWKTDVEGEVLQLSEDIKAGKGMHRDLVYEFEANSRDENDYGDSYVEVDLTDQHIYLYKDGELVLDSGCVTGNVYKGCGTHTGAYRVVYKKADAVLRGEDYETPVDFWMPFHNGEGLHDAKWRKSFGGTIYKGNGSHGCVNLPLSVAKDIFNTIEAGYPVMVYYTGDTEAEIAAATAPADAVVKQIKAIGEVTLDKAEAIMNARLAFTMLDEAHQRMVYNINDLVLAEQQLMMLQAGF